MYLHLYEYIWMCIYIYIYMCIYDTVKEISTTVYHLRKYIYTYAYTQIYECLYLFIHENISIYTYNHIRLSLFYLTITDNNKRNQHN
jgi:hypothetical protein